MAERVTKRYDTAFPSLSLNILHSYPTNCVLTALNVRLIAQMTPHAILGGQKTNLLREYIVFENHSKSLIYIYLRIT